MVGSDLRSEVLALDPVTGFGSRAALLARLELAVDPLSEPSVLAVFGLDGLDRVEEVHGTAATHEIIAALADEFARIVGPDGACFAPRRREFCVIFEQPLAQIAPILAAAAIALRREGTMTLITSAFGIALLPDQAADPVGALIVADRQLNQARRAQRKARRLSA